MVNEALEGKRRFGHFLDVKSANTMIQALTPKCLLT